MLLWLVANFGGDRDEDGGDRVVHALDHDLLDRAGMMQRLAEGAYLAARTDIRNCRRAGHVVVAVVISDFDSVLQHNVLGITAIELQGNFCDRNILILVVPAAGIRPAANAAQEMQLRRSNAHARDLDFLWMRFRVVLSALQNDQVVARSCSRGIYHFEGHVAGFYQTKLAEAQSFVSQVAAVEKAVRRARRERGLQIDYFVSILASP